MDNQTLLYLLVAILGIIAISFAVQAITMIVMMRNVRDIKSRVDTMAPKAEELLNTAKEALKTTRGQVDELTVKVDTILETAKTQLTTTNEFLIEATTRARSQLGRVELVLDDTIGRVHETVTVINDGVVTPARQVAGIIAGVRSALDFLLRGARPDVSRATTDEEMFI